MPLTRIEKTRVRITLVESGALCSDVKFEMLIRQPSRDVRLLVGCSSLEVRIHVEARDLEAGS